MTDELNTEAEAVDLESMMNRVDRLLDHAKYARAHGEDGQADAAMARAEAIMLKYNIDAATLASRPDAAQSSPVESQRVEFTGIYKAALVVEFNRLVRAFTTIVVPFTERHGTVYELVLVGPRDELRQLRALIASVQLQAIKAMETWWFNQEPELRYPGMLGFRTRRTYLTTFVAGATVRIERARQLVTAEASSGANAVVLVRRNQVDAYVEAHYSLRPDRTRRKAGTVDAAVAGYAAGQLANTNDTVTNDRRLLT